jgi:hypothetical protein
VFNAGMHADVQPCRAGVRRLRRARAGRRALLAGVGSLVDVAGGMGAAAKAIISPGLSRMSKCSVLDLPHVISSIVPGEDAALVDYIVPGDMMEYIPPADAVFLKVCNC